MRVVFVVTGTATAEVAATMVTATAVVVVVVVGVTVEMVATIPIEVAHLAEHVTFIKGVLDSIPNWVAIFPTGWADVGAI